MAGMVEYLAGLKNKGAAKARDWYTGLRDDVLFAIQGAPDNPQLDLHEGYSKDMYKAFAPVVGPGVGSEVIENLGQANELVAGVLDASRGRPFFGETGYDVGDIAANRRGMLAGADEAAVQAITRRKAEYARAKHILSQLGPR